MNLTAYILDQALKQLKLPESSLRQFRIASALSDVGGNGFPKELFQLSAPLVVRGLLNFATLQMNRDWVYPYWVHRQLDPADVSFIPRSQNPLLLNVTHRNWTMLGSPNGVHEAIVDRRGLATPLPREWSLDVWIHTGDRVVFPSLAHDVAQEFNVKAPLITTVTAADNVQLRVEHFVDSTNRNIDVLFQRAQITNTGDERVSGALCIAIRPFNPEGVAPIQTIDFDHGRFVYIDKVLGVAFARQPDWTLVSNALNGDAANVLRRIDHGEEPKSGRAIHCPRGLANAVAAFTFDLGPGRRFDVDCSVGLNSEKELRHHPIKQSWRVSFEKRREIHATRWSKELSQGSLFQFADDKIQNIFDASRLALLQLQEDDFISPGPFLYHHFWFRDAAPMVRALDLLGFEKRAHQVIDGFRRHQKADGFFRGPDGEWDSNGTVLWSVYRHFLLTRSRAWLQAWYPQLLRGARWILNMRKRSSDNPANVEGLMPPSLSAEHLGTVDQYFWDSFWSVAGLYAFASIAEVLEREEDAAEFSSEAISFEEDVQSAILSLEERLGQALIPATPHRMFDESAIGSIASVYPLKILANLPNAANTVREIDRRFTDTRGFYHPIVHSGYNPYLTLQLAHCYLVLGDARRAWELAESIFRQTPSPYSLPEAIHPKSGGGSMGDGHHGWAAAEIVLFLRDCMVREAEGKLVFFGTKNCRVVSKGRDTRIADVPTDFGLASVSLQFESDTRCVLKFQNEFIAENRPGVIEVLLPFATSKVAASSPSDVLTSESTSDATIIRCSSTVRTIFIDL